MKETYIGSATQGQKAGAALAALCGKVRHALLVKSAYREFSSVPQGVIKSNAKIKHDFRVPEGA